MTEKQIDGRTKRAADMALAKKQISQESYRAILAGTLPLAEAKSLGREGSPDTPPQPTSRISKDDRTPTKTPCLCGCGELVPRTFSQGHDMRMHRLAKAYVRGVTEPSEEQMAYLVESSKLERAKVQAAKEDERKQARIAKAAEREEAQRQRREAKQDAKQSE